MILPSMSSAGDPMSAAGRGPVPDRGGSGPGLGWFEGLTGKLLIAMPGIGDPRFERAVILMCVHSSEQAMGVTVNRPLEGVTLRSVMGRLGVDGAEAAPDQDVLSGGPVERERGFVLHTDDYETLDSTLPIGSGISMTATREVLDALADADRRPHRSRLVLGCASWAPGQLEGELAQNVWLTAEVEADIVFDDAHDTKWSRALAGLGISADRLSAAAGHA